MMNKTPSDLFFRHAREIVHTMDRAIAQSRLRARKGLPPAGGYEQTLELYLGMVEFLRLWAEGHRRPMQELLREQPLNRRSVNLVAAAAELLDHWVPADEEAGLRALRDDELEHINLTLEFLVESVQGPCPGNQYCLAVETSAIDVCRRVLGKKLAKRGGNTRLGVARVRGSCAKLLSALVEGGDEPLVNARIVDKLGWECISTLLINLHDRLEQLLTLRRRLERARTCAGRAARALPTRAGLPTAAAAAAPPPRPRRGRRRRVRARLGRRPARRRARRARCAPAASTAAATRR